MTENGQTNAPAAPYDGAPTWLRALQAAVVGVIAGLALYAILAVVVLQAGGGAPDQTGPRECKKSSPARESVTPALEGPVSSTRGRTRVL